MKGYTMKAKALIPLCLACALTLTACAGKSASYALVEVPESKRQTDSKKKTTHRVTSREREPYTTERVEDRDLPTGTTEIRQAGVDGESEVTYEVTMIDGKEVSRTAVSERIIAKAVPQIIHVGIGESDDTEDTEPSRDRGEAAGERREEDRYDARELPRESSSDETPEPQSESSSEQPDILVLPDWSTEPSSESSAAPESSSGSAENTSVSVEAEDESPVESTDGN